ncbi:MAG: DUF501 domain-containing protein [Congregibacter sp.]
MSKSVDAATLELITQRLGRSPRGLREVAVWDARGEPMVIRVASLVDFKPFPTLFWLIDPALSLRIDREEATGTIAQLQSRVDEDAELLAAMTADHARHIALRESYVPDADRRFLEEKRQWSALAERGIGGIADRQRIRCLHTWYAAHLVVPNTVGNLLDARWAREASQTLRPAR